MKVLYISHNKEGSAWSSTANKHMLALDSVGVDVVSRTVKLNSFDGEYPDKIKEFENKDVNDVDYVIQHILPHHYQYFNRCKANIGFYLNDMDTLNIPMWTNKIGLMDRMWCPNLNTSHVLQPISKRVDIVPHPTDMSIYSKKYDKVELGNHNGNYIFYFIGELISRKNIRDMIRAFHTEFGINEPVSLLLKVNKAGVPSQKIMEMLTNEINNIKQSLKLYPSIEQYHKEIIVAGNIPQEEICQIHTTGNCYLNLSHGEAWSIPTFDAMMFGKQIIAPDKYYDYLDEANYPYNKVYPSSDDILGYNDTFFELGNAKEQWLNYSICNVRRAMRIAFNERDTFAPEIPTKKYDIYSIGKIMVDKLDEN